MTLPELRPAPPWVMEEMIAAEPQLAADLSAAAAGGPAEAIARLMVGAAERHEPIAVVGCGTSEHGAMAVARQLNAVLPGSWIASRQAFEAALEPWGSGVCLGITHEGETAATLDALRAAKAAGAATAVITAVRTSPVVALVDHALVTPLTDRSWCHTVGYLSPILGGASIAAAIGGGSVDGERLRARLDALMALRPVAEQVGAALGRASRYIVVGSGLDAVAARELALKIEEGAQRPAVGRDLETELHGHLVSADAESALIAISVEPAERDARVTRTGQLLRAARRLGMPTSAIVSASADEMLASDLTSEGRLVLPERPLSEPTSPVDTLADAAIALQLLTIGLVHAAGTNPDRIRRDEDAYREASALAES